MSDAEVDAFEDAVDDLADRVSEFLADGTDHTPADIEADVDELPMPDPLDDRAVEEVEVNRRSKPAVHGFLSISISSSVIAQP
ncbi:MAG: hypothetical protein U5K28_11990 [Halobacteriales archaeon]|nr:hypothetical protein [Halobacteriales archaeon]